jgi:hypothetical protein
MLVDDTMYTEKFSLLDTQEHSSDIMCHTCQVSFKIIVHEPYIHKWKTYRNPNADIIELHFNHLIKFVELCPIAIMTVCTILPTIKCPICQDEKSLKIRAYSKYDARSVLASLKLHSKIR